MKQIAIILLLALLAACENPIYYGSDYNQSLDFARLKTFAWHSPNQFNEASKLYIANDLVDERIHTRVDQELAAKGFKKTGPESADFLVNYSITTQDKVDMHTYNTYGSAYGAYTPHRAGVYGYGYYGGAPVASDVQVVQYKVGTFVLDVVDRKSGKLIWRGTAEGRMAKNTITPQEREARINEVILNVLKEFPPPKAKE